MMKRGRKNRGLCCRLAAMTLAASMVLTACSMEVTESVTDPENTAGVSTEITGDSQGGEASSGEDADDAPLPEETTEEPVTEEPTTEEISTEPDFPPRIHGTKDITVEVGGTVSYKKDVWVEDDHDPFPTLEIDNSAVDLNTVGVYPVTYLAVDFAGNVSKVIIRVYVVEPETEVDPAATEEEIEYMHQLARNALSECTWGGMAPSEELWAIFWYVKNNMNYVNGTDKSSWVHEAIRGFEENTGDCFTYFAVLRAMMEEAGYETVDMTRLGGETRHFWSLVKYKDQWYHIDACPRSPEHGKYWYCFLRTDKELAEFTETWGEGYYYVFDESLSPRTPEESLDLGYDIDGEGHEDYDEDQD